LAQNSPSRRNLDEGGLTLPVFPRTLRAMPTLTLKPNHKVVVTYIDRELSMLEWRKAKCEERERTELSP